MDFDDICIPKQELGNEENLGIRKGFKN